MARVLERKHPHPGGVIIARISEDDDGRFGVAVLMYAPDGRELVLGVGTWGRAAGYQDLIEAQRVADEQVVEIASAIGHECSEQCDDWPRQVLH